MAEKNKYLRTLVENAIQGKIVALQELYEINLNEVYALIRCLTGNKLMAELLTKNVLVRGWEMITKEVMEDEPFSEWLKTIAVIVVMDEFKNPTILKDKKTQKLIEKSKNSDSPSNHLEYIISELDDIERLFVVLDKVERYSLEDVSDFMGMTISDAEKKLSAAIEHIFDFSPGAETEVELVGQLKNLYKEIKADKNILNEALNEIKEIRAAEIKEEAELEIERKEEIKEIEKAIEKGKKENLKREKVWKGYRPAFYINKKFALIAVIPLIIFLGIQFASSSQRWSVTIESGAPLINDEPISSSVNLSDGDIIRTDSLSAAKIIINQIGEISVFGSTKFKRLNEKNSGELLKGKISIVAESSEDVLNIKIPEVTIENYGQVAAYSVETDQRGNSVIELENGWLKVYSDKNEVVIAPNYKLNIFPRSGAGIPYHSQNTFEYVTILDEYLFGGKRDVTLNRLLNSSSNNETITLWNLLLRVKPGQQTENVYYRLYELAPHSGAINKVDVLLLDSDILNLWLEEIKRNL